MKFFFLYHFHLGDYMHIYVSGTSAGTYAMGVTITVGIIHIFFPHQKFRFCLTCETL